MVSITQTNVARQRIASSENFLREVFGKDDDRYCEMECRRRGHVMGQRLSRDDEVMYTWMVEYIGHVIGTRDERLCDHHCGMYFSNGDSFSYTFHFSIGKEVPPSRILYLIHSELE